MSRLHCLFLTILLWGLAGAPLAAATAPSTVVGRVVDAENRPIAGALVTTRPIEAAYDKANRRLSGASLDVRAQATTDADGMYRLALPAGMSELEVGGSGFCPVASIVGPVRGEQTLASVSLPSCVPFVGSGDLALPVARTLEALALWPWQGAVEARIGAGGRTSVQVPARGEVVLHVGRPGSTPLEVRLFDGKERPRPPRPEGLVELLVRRSGHPIAEAIVTIAASHWPLGRTNTDGALALAVPTGGRLDLLILGSDGASVRATVDAPAANDRQPRRLVELPAPQRMRFTVVDGASHRPIDGATVVTSERQTGTTNKHGVVDLVAGGPELGVLAGASGFVRQSHYGILDGATTLALDRAASATVTVVDERRAAVERVRVDAVGSSTADRERCWLARTSATTAGQGMARFDHLDPACRWHFVVAPSGWVVAEVSGVRLVPGGQVALELVPTRGTVGTVLVLDQGDQPIVGALVGLVPAREAEWYDGRPQPPTGTTGVDGIARVSGLAAGRHELQVEAAGFGALAVPNIVVEDINGSVDLGTVVMLPEAFARVDVVDTEGRALGGARTWATTLRVDVFELGLGLGKEPPPAAVAGADGRVVLGGFVEGATTDVVAEVEGFVRGSVRATAGGEVAQLVLRRPTRVAGTVVDEHDRPLEGAQVWLSGMLTIGNLSTSAGPLETRSGVDGGFVFEDMRATEGSLSARLAGRRETSKALGSLHANVADVVLRLEPGARVLATVRGSAGEPVEGVAVSEADLSYGLMGLKTDATGEVVLDGVGLGPRKIAARGVGYQPSVVEVTVVAGDNPVDFSLRPGAAIRGRVVGDGAPVAGARIDFEAEVWRPEWRQPTYSAADGSFSIEDLDVGQHTVRVLAEGWANAAETVMLVEGETAEVEVELERGTTITGRILGLDPTAFAGCSVSARSQSGGLSGTVDFEGNYRIEGVVSGTWEVLAQAKDRSARAETTIVAGVATTVDLEFPTGVAIAGVVVVDGAPGANFSVRAKHPGELPLGFTTTDAVGRFRFETVTAGTVALEAVEPTSRLAVDLVVEVGDTDVLDLELSTTSAALVGHVVDSAGRPVAGATATLYRESNAPIALESNSAGRFEQLKVTPGRAWLLVAADGYAGRRHDLDLVSGITTELEVTLEAAADLNLIVAGVVPRSVQVALRSTDGATVLVERVDVGPQGAGRIRSAPAGTFEVHVATEGRPSVRFATRLPSTETHAVVFEPVRRVEVRVEDSGGAVEFVVRDAFGKVASFISWRGEVRERLTLQYGRVPIELPDGAWTLEASAADGRRWTGAVPPTGAATVSLELTEAGSR